MSVLIALVQFGHRRVERILHREPWFGHLGASGKLTFRNAWGVLIFAGLLLVVLADGFLGILMALGVAYLWHLAGGRASAWRLELGVAIGLGVAVLVAGMILPGPVAILAVALIVGFFAWQRRDELVETLRLRGLWRRFLQAARHLGLAGPIVADSIERTPIGYRLRVRVGRGAVAEDLDPAPGAPLTTVPGEPTSAYAIR